MATPRFASLVELYLWSTRTHGHRPVIGTRRDGTWHWRTRREVAADVDRFRGGLAAVGVGAGDRVAIVSNNRLEWAVACYATYGLGATFVPMYEEQLPKEWEFILGDCEAKVVIGSTADIHRELCTLESHLPKLEQVIGIDLPESDPASFAALMRRGESHPVAPVLPDGETTAGFIYTSGTTGAPKGVVLSHGNIASNVNALMEAFPIGPDERSVSFLPWAHSYGQVVELHYGVASGSSAALNDRIEHLVDDIAEVQPTLLVAVPRVFNQMYESVLEEVTSKGPALQKLFWDGVRASIRRGRGDTLRAWPAVELRLDDRLIFSKVRRILGGRLKMVFSGSAALGREVAEFIDAIGIPLYEGYGLSETSPVVAMNRPGDRRFGSVGKPLPGVRVVIDTTATGDSKEGEVIVYGPNVMKRYHNRPDETAAALMPDGGLRTGDLGFFDEDGFLYVSGRIKEQYKLQNGKYVMPAPLEEKLKLSPYISNAMLYGANKPYNVLLVVPDMIMLEKWAEHEGTQIEDVTHDARVDALIRAEIEERSGDFKKFEVPHEHVIVADDFTTENDLLTPTLKIKRRNVVTRYGDLLEAMYRNAAPQPRRVPPYVP